MVFYMDLYRKCDFLCEGCVEFYYDRRRQEMLDIQKVVSIEEYNATNKKYCDKCESMNGITLSLIKMEIIIYYVMVGCVKFFISLKNKEMGGIKDIEKVR